MSTATQELIAICEKLPEAERREVVDFAQTLLARNHSESDADRFERWLKHARGKGIPGVTTDSIMEMTRGEP